MIVADSSALIEIASVQSQARACASALEAAERVLMSAATMAETVIVARRRSVGPAVERLIEFAGIEIVPLTRRRAWLAADAYDRWGKGVHPAGLNLGDCFAYALALERDCPLLYVGNDFARTDIRSALRP